MSRLSKRDILDKIPSPSFVLEEAKLKRNLELLQKVQDESGANIILAFKGFAMWESFGLVKKYLKGATASSLNEVLLCNDKLGMKSHTYFVAYSESEFDAVVEKSSHISFNSLSQFDRFKSKVSGEVSIGLRVNPQWSDVSTDLYNPASPQSRLGETEDNLPDQLPDEIEGLHFHVLCESSAESLVEVLRHFEERFGRYLHQVSWVNMGGGHLITKEGYNVELLIKTLKEFKEKYDVEIWLEPGGAVAWQTGFLKTQVLDIIENGGVKTALIDASFSCHMPDCLEMPYRPKIDCGSSDLLQYPYQYRLGGVSCLAGDFLEVYSFDRELKVGDPIIFEDMIHYTMVKTTFFNGVNHPDIGILSENGDYKVVRQFGYDDYKHRLS